MEALALVVETEAGLEAAADPLSEEHLSREEAGPGPRVPLVAREHELRGQLVCATEVNAIPAHVVARSGRRSRGAG
eukprot:14647538-Alexandrium_andersonii.AAC.1